MSRTKVLRRAALLVASAAELLLTTSSTVPNKGEITPPVVEPGDGWTQLWEPRYCTACDQEGPFWAIYEPEGEDTHAFMTMCMTCGAINGDLPEEDPAHWLNVFRSEPHDNTVYEIAPDCTIAGVRETVCFRCGWSETETLPALGHQYGLWTVETPPGPGTEGAEVRACIRCGEVERRSIPALPIPTPTEPEEIPPASTAPAEPPIETMQPSASQVPAESEAPVETGAPAESKVPAESEVPKETPGTVPEPRTTVEPAPTDTAEPLPSASPLQTEPPETMPPEPLLPPLEPSAVPSQRPAQTTPEVSQPAETADPVPPDPTVPPRETPTVRVPEPAEPTEPAETPAPMPAPTAAPRAYGPYVSGTPEGLFLPKKDATRAEVLVMLGRLLADQNGDVLPEGRQIYADVPPDCWYSPAVTYLFSLGILPTDGEDAYLEPDHPVSAAELAGLLNEIFPGTWTGDRDRILTREECVVWINYAAGREPDPVWFRDHLEQLKTFPDLSEEGWAWADVLDAANGNRDRVN